MLLRSPAPSHRRSERPDAVVGPVEAQLDQFVEDAHQPVLGALPAGGVVARVRRGADRDGGLRGQEGAEGAGGGAGVEGVGDEG